MPTPVQIEPDSVNYFAQGLQFFENFECGPWEFGNKRHVVYTRLNKTTGDEPLAVARTLVSGPLPDPPNYPSFEVLDVANAPLTGGNQAACRPPLGNTIYIAYPIDTGSPRPIHIISFDMAAGLYGTPSPPGPSGGIIFLKNLPSGSLFVLYEDNTTSLPTFKGVYFSGGAWGTPFTMLVLSTFPNNPNTFWNICVTSTGRIWYTYTIEDSSHTPGQFYVNHLDGSTIGTPTPVGSNCTLGFFHGFNLNGQGFYISSSDTVILPFATVPIPGFGDTNPFTRSLTLVTITAASTTPVISLEDVADAPAADYWRMPEFWLSSDGSTYYANVLSFQGTGDEIMLLLQRPSSGGAWSSVTWWDHDLNPPIPTDAPIEDAPPLSTHLVLDGKHIGSVLGQTSDICADVYYIEGKLTPGGGPSGPVGIATMRNARRGISTPQGGIAA